QVVFLYFAEIFPENSLPRWGRLLLSAAPLIVFVPALLQGKFWTHARFQENQFSIALTRYAYAAGIYNTINLIAGVLTSWTKYRRHRDTLWGKQIVSVMTSMLITGTLMVVSVNILPAFGDYRLLPFCSIFIVVGALIYAYAITNFQLFS